jgi:hypothetical protein
MDNICIETAEGCCICVQRDNSPATFRGSAAASGGSDRDEVGARGPGVAEWPVGLAVVEKCLKHKFF